MTASARVYLDYNASAPMRPEVVEACGRAMLLAGNPSSVHAEGRAARAAIEAARDQVAGLVGGDPARVFFTSGGTEAANTVLSSALSTEGGTGATRLLVGATEHPCVRDGHRFATDRADTIPVDGDGVADLGWLQDRLNARAGERILVSLQVANNETGVLQPVAEAAALAHAAGGLLHTDAVQAAGKAPLSMAALRADALTLSAHKLAGPKGVGAIVLADGIKVEAGLLRGGGHERGRRAGTENLVGIVGFGVAAEIARRDLDREAARIAALRDRLEAEIRRGAPDAVIFAEDRPRLPNTVAFAVPGCSAQTAMIALDLDGMAVSSGAACSSGKVSASRVMTAMGVDPVLAAGTLRLSLGWGSSEEDVCRFAAAFEKLVRSLYKRRRDKAA